jgi:hypothetical protein
VTTRREAAIESLANRLVDCLVEVEIIANNTDERHAREIIRAVLNGSTLIPEDA